MTLYLYVAGGMPALVGDEERALYERHPLIGTYTDPLEAFEAYDRAMLEAVVKIRPPLKALDR
jgi:hypothetical protein